MPLEENSDNFVFDNEMLAQAIYHGFRIGEVSCPTHYFTDASSINFAGSVRYGLGVLRTYALAFRLLNRWGPVAIEDSLIVPGSRKLPIWGSRWMTIVLLPWPRRRLTSD